MRKASSDKIKVCNKVKKTGTIHQNDGEYYWIKENIIENKWKSLLK